VTVIGPPLSIHLRTIVQSRAQGSDRWVYLAGAEMRSLSALCSPLVGCTLWLLHECKSAGREKTTMTMGCIVRQVEGVTILDLSGRLSLGEVLAFRPGRDLPLNEVVRELTNDGHMKILLNLAGVKYVDSSGVGQLVGTLTSARSQGVELKMFNPAKPVLDLLKMTKLLAVFDVRESEEAAIAAFSKGATARA
jgi:anti-sigma B factor antagonist